MVRKSESKSKSMPVHSFIHQVIGFLVIALLVVTPACKKGENDPGLSFKSRKSRLAGSWTLQSATLMHGDTTTVFDGDSLATTVDSITNTLAMTGSFQFNKDGTYGEETVTDFPTNWQGNGQPAFTQTETITGIWNFTGGGGGVKSKSQLLLQVTERSVAASNSASNVVTTAYSGQTAGFVYDINRLASKELTLKYDLTTTSTKGTLLKTAELKLVK